MLEENVVKLYNLPVQKTRGRVRLEFFVPFFVDLKITHATVLL